MPQKIPSPKKFISIRFNETADPLVFVNQVKNPLTGLPPLGTFKLTVPDGQQATLSMQAAGWPGTYPDTTFCFMNESWPGGSLDVADVDTHGNADVVSSGEMEFTYSKAARIISWKQGSLSGSAQLDSSHNTPSWYVTLRLAKASDTGSLVINGRSVCDI